MIFQGGSGIKNKIIFGSRANISNKIIFVKGFAGSLEPSGTGIFIEDASETIGLFDVSGIFLNTDITKSNETIEQFGVSGVLLNILSRANETIEQFGVSGVLLNILSRANETIEQFGVYGVAINTNIIKSNETVGLFDVSGVFLNTNIVKSSETVGLFDVASVFLNTDIAKSNETGRFGVSGKTLNTDVTKSNETVGQFGVSGVMISSGYIIEPDPYINNVSLLLHMDGENASTIFTDSSINNLTGTRNGAPFISTAIPKFGSAAGYFDSSTDYLTYSSNSLFGFGTGDFTIEMWIYPQGTNSFQGFFNIGTYQDGILMRWHANTVADSLYINNTVYNWSPSTNALRNTWTHVALVRNSGAIKMFAGGINRIGSVTNTSDIGSTRTALIGASAHNVSEGFNGYIDEIRVTKGIARYTSDFTPPTAPFANP